MTSSIPQSTRSLQGEQPPLYLSALKPEEYAFRLLIRTRMLAIPEKMEETVAMVRQRVQNIRSAVT